MYVLAGHMGFKSLATYYHLMDDDLNRPTQLVHELSAGSLLSAQSSGGVGTAASSNPSSYAPAQTSSTSTSPAPTSSSRPSQSDGAQPAASAGSGKPSSESKDVASPQAQAKSETCVTGAGQGADTTKEQASESKAQEGSSTSEQSRLEA